MGFIQTIKKFAEVELAVRKLIAAIFCIQLIESSLFLLLNYYLKSLSYSDAEVAELTAYRFTAIMLLALPLGLWIKGRKLKPFFLFGSLLLPTCTLLGLLSLRLGSFDGAALAMLGWGLARICLNVTALPYIILNAPKEQHSEAITLYFMSFSLTVFLMGLLYYLLSSIWPEQISEEGMLWAVSLLGFAGFFILRSIKIEERVSERVALRQSFVAYDWGLIAQVSIPTVLIAVGAGLTIPFINLFFQHVHGVEASSFSLLGSLSFVAVTAMMIFVPSLQRRYGYGVAISLFQSLAVLALFIMATTEYYAQNSWAAPIAMLAYFFRQPLMNVAGPSTSELSLKLVGERNQEIISALNAAIWSGSWFLSSVIFGYLRAKEVAYVNIFLLTVGFYTVAIVWYAYLVRLYYRKTPEEAAEPEKKEEIDKK